MHLPIFGECPTIFRTKLKIMSKFLEVETPVFIHKTATLQIQFLNFNRLDNKKTFEKYIYSYLHESTIFPKTIS